MMQKCNDSVTLWIPYSDAGDSVYQIEKIPNVSWYEGREAGVSDKGMLSNDGIVIRIPESSVRKPFLDYKKWLEAEDRDSFWSLCTGMKISYGDDPYRHAVTVVSFACNTKGQKPHYKVVCR